MSFFLKIEGQKLRAQVTVIKQAGESTRRSQVPWSSDWPQHFATLMSPGNCSKCTLKIQLIYTSLQNNDFLKNMCVERCEWVKVAQSCPTLCVPIDDRVHGLLQAKILEWVALSFFQGIFPNPGIEPRSPALQTDSLPAEPPGKPKNTGVGSLSLFWRMFLTRESNRGLLHCRQILYQKNIILHIYELMTS